MKSIPNVLFTKAILLASTSCPRLEIQGRKAPSSECYGSDESLIRTVNRAPIRKRKQPRILMSYQFIDQIDPSSRKLKDYCSIEGRKSDSPYHDQVHAFQFPICFEKMFVRFVCFAADEIQYSGLVNDRRSCRFCAKLAVSEVPTELASLIGMLENPFSLCAILFNIWKCTCTNIFIHIRCSFYVVAYASSSFTPNTNPCILWRN